MANKITVKDSAIQGMGVFAGQPIKKGEVAVAWENTRELSAAEFAGLDPEEQRYTDRQDGRIFLLGKPERCVNHSCSANTIPGHLCDIASRDIVAGEEITADYRAFYLPKGGFACSCGSVNCAGQIRGRAEP